MSVTDNIMIKITNLNFQTQTIENIEVDCESIDNIEIKMTKKEFNIIIFKNGEVFKKKIKKKDVSETDLVIEVTMEEIDKDNNKKIEVFKEKVNINSNKLHEDILLSILEYNPYNFNVSTYFNTYTKKYFETYVNKIKKWWKYHSITKNDLIHFLESYDCFYEENLTYNTLLKYMLFRMPKKEILKLPEYVANREYNINIFNEDDFQTDDEEEDIDEEKDNFNWLIIEFDEDTPNRRVYNVYQFFKKYKYSWINKDMLYIYND